HQVQLQPQVLEVGRAVDRHGQRGVQPRFAAGEQLVDDVVLVAEVVVQVARADAQVRGDVVGGDVRFALRVEQRQGRVEDALVGVPGQGQARRRGTAAGPVWWVRAIRTGANGPAR